MPKLNDSLAYLNGEFLPLSKAKISVLDRGFLFGDGVYEVIPAYAGKLFRLTDHIHRLNASLHQIKLKFSQPPEYYLKLLKPLLDNSKNQAIYLQITRGVTTQREHAFPMDTVPTVFAMCSEIKPYQITQKGVKALSIEDSRWEMCHIKATTLLANILLKQQALDQGCAEAILLKDGYVTEGAASNLFAVINNILVTPKKSTELLPGITRQVILELALANEIKFNEAIISYADLLLASEIWMTSSTREIVPVIEIDSKIIGDGMPGPAWHSMNKLFQNYKKSL